ncbi:hypothetical protein ABTH53_20065, partial [Acinetobacter baumannii]
VRPPAPRHQGDHRELHCQGHPGQDGHGRPAAHWQGDCQAAGHGHQHVHHRSAPQRKLLPFFAHSLMCLIHAQCDVQAPTSMKNVLARAKK